MNNSVPLKHRKLQQLVSYLLIILKMCSSAALEFGIAIAISAIKNRRSN